MQSNPLSEFVLLCGAMLVGIGLYAWLQRNINGARLFSVFTLSQALYVLAYSMELASLSLPVMLFWSRIEYIGILTFPTLYLVFIIQYIGKDKWLSIKNFCLLFFIPLLFLVIKLNDDSLHLIYNTAILETNGSIQLLSFTRGPLYLWVVFYNLGIITFANVLLWQKRRYSSSLFRSQASSLLFAAGFIYFVYIIYLSGFQMVPGMKSLDLNPFVYTIWVLAITWAIFRYHLFDLTPIARDVLIETLNDGVMVLDEQYRIVDVNPAALKIFNLDLPPIGDLAVRLFQKWDYQTAPSHIIENSILNRPGLREIRHESNGKTIYYEINISTLEDKQGKLVGRLLVLHDITTRKMDAVKLLELSLEDELTGLNNRRGFYLLANQMIQMAHRMLHHAGLIYTDLDNLKWINDNLGHAAGDQAIVETANILKNAIRSSDIIARMGGDEFVILAIESKEYSSTMIETRVQENLKKYNTQKNRRYKLALSFGYAEFDPENPTSLDLLIEKADHSMYEQKLSKKKDLQNYPAKLPKTDDKFNEDI